MTRKTQDLLSGIYVREGRDILSLVTQWDPYYLLSISHGTKW